MGRIEQGLVPDGSGNPIADVALSDIYWVLLGRSTNQVGYGGKAAGGTATIASTTNPTKGYVYLGESHGVAFDETNTRVGISETTPSARLHILVPTPINQLLLPDNDNTSDPPGIDWGKQGGSGDWADLVNEDSDSTYWRWTPNLGSTNNDVDFLLPTDPGTDAGWKLHVTVRCDHSQTNSRMGITLTNVGGGGATWMTSKTFGGPNHTGTPASEGNVTASFATYTINIPTGEAAVASFAATEWRLAVLFTGVATGTGNWDFSKFKLEVPAVGSGSAETLQIWETADGTLSQLDFGSDGNVGVDLQLTGAAEFYISVGDLSSGLRTYASASAQFLEAGLTDQTNMNLTLAGNRQATGTLLTSQFTNTKLKGSLQFDGSTSGTLTHSVPAAVTSHTLIWPSAQGAAASFLQHTATPGTLQWATFSALTSAEFRDDAFRIIGSSDGTKKLAFEVDGLTTATTRTLTPQDASYILAGTNITQTFSKRQVISYDDGGLTQPFQISANSAGGGSGFYFLQITDLGLGADVVTCDGDGNFVTMGSFTLASSGGAFIKITGSPTGTRTWTIDGTLASTTFMGLGGTQTITGNKTATGQFRIDTNGTSATDFALRDATDTSKLFVMDLTGLGTGTTRAWGVQNLNGTVPVVGNDPPAVAAGALGKVDLTAQTANITTTNLSSTPPAGDYVIEVYLLCTTADAAAGTLTVTIGWTDNVGATTSTPITGFALTATGRTTGRQHVRVNSGDITYAVAVTGGYGTSQYAIYVRVIALG